MYLRNELVTFCIITQICSPRVEISKKVKHDYLYHMLCLLQLAIQCMGRGGCTLNPEAEKKSRHMLNCCLYAKFVLKFQTKIQVCLQCSVN